MKTLPNKILLTLVLAGSALTGRAQFVDEPKQYSYQMVTNQSDGHTATMMMYVDNDKRRIETNLGGRNTVLIYRGDQGKSYLLSPENRTYLETPLNPQIMQRFKNPVEFAKQRGGSFKKVGTEEVNNEPCDKYTWTYTRPAVANPPAAAPDAKPAPTPADQSAPISGTTWISQRTHLPVKSQTERFTMETKDVKLGAPDASLFQPPSDYKKLSAGQ
jgi:hypothetical protein